MFRVLCLGALLSAACSFMVANESKALAADNFTAFGSMLNVNASKLPVTTIGIGFSECGIDLLGQVLNKHPDTIAGKQVEKNYFAKRYGNCNRFAARNKAKSPFMRYVGGCFQNKIPNSGQALIDVSNYGMSAWSGMIPTLKAMTNETVLRFLAVVCDPRERTLQSLKTKNGQGSAHEGNYSELSHNVSQAMKTHLRHGFSEHIASGEYTKMVVEWTKHFPLSSLMLINSEALSELETWRRIFFHIGVAEPTEKQLKKWIGQGSGELLKPRELNHVNHIVKKRLTNTFKLSDKALWNLINLEWW